MLDTNHPETASRAYLQMRDLSKVYNTDQGALTALDEINVTQRQGEFLSIVGPSGCGKSTLLSIAAGLSFPSAGEFQIDGKPVTAARTDIGIVFQSPVLLEWRTVLGNIMLQAEAKKLVRRDAERRARDLLKAVGLEGFENKYPHELSGGMRQRVSICRALIHEPKHLLMDEPFGALDALSRDQLIVDLQRICADRATSVLLITHNFSEAVFLSDRVIVMSPRPGRIDKVIEIDLARPRRLGERDGPKFAKYTREILDIFLARGVLHEH